DRVAAIVDRDEALETHLTGVPRHADDRQSGAEAPRGLVLAEEDRGFEARRLLRRQTHSAVGELADPIPADDLFRHALHLEAASDRLQIFGARLEKSRREPTALVANLVRGLRERVAAEASAAAPERSDRLRCAQGVTVADDHVFVGDAEMVGDDLGECGLVPLSMRARSRDRRDLAAPLHAYEPALPAEHVRGFDVRRDADPHDLAATARRGLLSAERLIVRQLDHAIEGTRVVAGVVGGAERWAVGKRVGRGEIARTSR